jgi:hypothetical protein
MPWTVTLPSGPVAAPRNLAWMAQAGCRDKPGEWFFPEHPRAGAYNQGKAVCATCPVVSTCWAYIRHSDPDAEWSGLWAGLTPTQRKTLVRRHHADERRTRAAGSIRCTSPSQSRSGQRRGNRVDQIGETGTGSTKSATQAQSRSRSRGDRRVDQARTVTVGSIGTAA